MEKFLSRKFILSALSIIITVTGAVVGIGGTVGTVACIVGAIASAISYVVTEGVIDAKAVNMIVDVAEKVKDAIVDDDEEDTEE